MNWLIWKEFRLQRLALAVGLFLLVAPYALPVYFYWFLAAKTQSALWQVGAVWSMALSVLTLALLGGNAIASERIDRSAEFQAYQPISRWKLVLGKLLLPLSAAFVAWGANLIAPGFDAFDESVLSLSIFAIAGFCAFGVAWFVSSFQDSPTFAATSGVVAPIAVFSLIPLVAWRMNLQSSGQITLVTSITICALLIGLLGFSGGVWHYLRRVEP